jgi:hypothetical protein
MARPRLEVADIFRAHGPAWRKANAGHVSLGQLKVMSAIENCRTAALGGHVERCEGCAHERVAYNSCRNRHCPKCQGAAARQWLAEREAELLPVPYYHIVFTLPAAIRALAFANKDAFDAALAPLRRSEWVVYAKRPFAGPAAVLAYLARYTHRVAISNSRLVAFDEAGVTFRWKDYRIKGRDRFKTMTLDAAEFIRRFLMHVLPSGFHRIRHYGLFASAVRAQNVERARQLLATSAVTPAPSCAKAGDGGESPAAAHRCPCCGGRMIIIETFEGVRPARAPSPSRIRIDTS